MVGIDVGGAALWRSLALRAPANVAASRLRNSEYLLAGIFSKYTDRVQAYILCFDGCLWALSCSRIAVANIASNMLRARRHAADRCTK